MTNYLFKISGLQSGSRVLDVGCGIGGTSRFLAKSHGCAVTGITISGHQVDMARRITAADVNALLPSEKSVAPDEEGVVTYPDAGSTRFLELDAHVMSARFDEGTFDCVWICEALYHMREKEAIFSSAFSLLAPGGTLVLAEWFKAPELTNQQQKKDIAPIEKGMLTQRLRTLDEYLRIAETAGFRLRQEPINVSKQVARTW